MFHFQYGTNKACVLGLFVSGFSQLRSNSHQTRCLEVLFLSFFKTETEINIKQRKSERMKEIEREEIKVEKRKENRIVTR